MTALPGKINKGQSCISLPCTHPRHLLPRNQLHALPEAPLFSVVRGQYSFRCELFPQKGNKSCLIILLLIFWDSCVFAWVSSMGAANACQRRDRAPDEIAALPRNNRSKPLRASITGTHYGLPLRGAFCNQFGRHTKQSLSILPSKAPWNVFEDHHKHF